MALGQVLGERLGVHDGTDLGLDNEVLVRSALAQRHKHIQTASCNPLLQLDLDHLA